MRESRRKEERWRDKGGREGRRLREKQENKERISKRLVDRLRFEMFFKDR